MQNKTKRRKGKKMIITLIVIVVVIVALKFILFPPVKQILTTGIYQVSSTDYWLTQDKADPYSKNGEQRQLQIRRWYPSDCAETKPVFVASHGSCGTIDNNLSLYRELASHGFIVLAVAHPGQVASIKYENGKKSGPSGDFIKEMTSLRPDKNPEQAFELFQKWMKIRIDDLNVVMDDYVKREGKADFVMLGHSLGGSAAYAMARIRKDVIGCIALESPFMYDITAVKDGHFVFNDSDYDVPLLNVYSDSSFPYLKVWEQYKNNAKFLDSYNPVYTNIHYEGIGHMGLCDLSLASPVLASIFSGKIQKRSARAMLAKLNEDCLNWIEVALLDKN